MSSPAMPAFEHSASAATTLSPADIDPAALAGAAALHVTVSNATGPALR